MEVFEASEESWSLDYQGMKKLQKIIKHSQSRKLGIIQNRSKSKSEIKVMEIEEMIKAERSEYVKSRLLTKGLRNASRFAVLGDEFSLRQEIEDGYNVNIRDGVTGRSLLHEASAAGHYHIVKMLCSDYNSNIQMPTMLGSATALHLAVDADYRQVASLLITFGADVNSRDRNGNSPIYYAHSLPLIKLLLRYNIDVCTKNKNTLTPKEYYEKVSPLNIFNPDIFRAIEMAEEEQVIEIKKAKSINEKAMVKKANAITNSSQSAKNMRLLLSQPTKPSSS